MSSGLAIKWYRKAPREPEMARKNIAIGGYDISAFLAHGRLSF